MRRKKTLPRAKQSTRPLFLEPLEARQLLSYTITDLGTFGGPISAATGINAAGQVAGSAYEAGAGADAFLWDPTTGLQDLGTLGGSTSTGTAINNAGQVAGSSLTAEGLTRAFLWDPDNGMQNLGTLGGNFSAAAGLNDAGQVVGNSFTADGAQHATLWDPSAGVQDLGTLDNPNLSSFAYGINNSGQVVGSSQITGGPVRAFLWDPDNGMQDLGTLGGRSSMAIAINDAGQVVGSAFAPDEYPHAFLWDAKNGMQDLGTLGGLDSFATALDSTGDVVGRVELDIGQFHAFLYQAGKTMDLNGLIDPNSGWTLTEADGINDQGQIVGKGVSPDGHTHGFLLTPDEATGLRGQLRSDHHLAQPVHRLPLVDHFALAALAPQPSYGRVALPTNIPTLDRREVLIPGMLMNAESRSHAQPAADQSLLPATAVLPADSVNVLAAEALALDLV